MGPTRARGCWTIACWWITTGAPTLPVGRAPQLRLPHDRFQAVRLTEGEVVKPKHAINVRQRRRIVRGYDPK